MKREELASLLFDPKYKIPGTGAIHWPDLMFGVILKDEGIDKQPFKEHVSNLKKVYLIGREHGCSRVKSIGLVLDYGINCTTKGKYLRIE